MRRVRLLLSLRPPTGSASTSGTSTPRTVPLSQYNELVTRFNQLNDTIAKLRDRKEFYKGETVSLSGSLSDNRDALIEAVSYTHLTLPTTPYV